MSAPITNAQFSGSDNQLKSGATLTLKAGSTVVLESGATFTVPDATWSIAKVNGLAAALALLAPLASALLTGDPKAPTPASTDDDTSIATSAFAQALVKLLLARGSLTISAAADSTITATAQQRRIVTDATVAAGGGAYTHNIVLATSNAQAGDVRRVLVYMPASVNPTIRIYNASTGGTLLTTIPTDAAVVRSWVVETHYNGSAWASVTVSLLDVRSATETAIGLLELATAAETITGTDNVRATHAAGVRAALQTYVDPIAATRAGGDQIISDGATTNRAQIQVPGARGNLAGAISATWRGLVTVPASNPTANIIIAAICPASTSATTGGNLIHITLESGNSTLGINEHGSADNIYRNFKWANFRSTYSGQTGFLEVYFVQGTTNPVVRWNDVDISASFTSATQGGSPPAWLDAALVATYHLTGYNWPAGSAPLGCWINGALSAADRAFWTATGKPPAWVASGGSMRSLTDLTGVGGDFSANPTGGAWGMTLDAGVTWSGSAVDFNTTGAAFLRAVSSTAAPDGIWAGRKYWVRFTISNYVSGSFGVCRSTGTPFGVVSGTSILTGNGTATCIIEETAGSFSRLMIGSLVATPMVATLDNLYWGPIGAISLPGVQPIAVLDDVTSIGGNPARLLGMIPVTDNRWWRISAETATNGNQQLLGGDVFDSTRDVIDTIEQVTTGTPTTTIGSASAGAQYKASGALSAGINPTTLVTRKLASNAVWVGSGTTDTIRTTITGHRAN